jgi:hypothetical protein
MLPDVVQADFREELDPSFHYSEATLAPMHQITTAAATHISRTSVRIW